MNTFSPSHDPDYPITNLKEGDVMEVQAVDTHAHGRREEYAGTEITPQNSVIEAAAGGINTVFFMPNTKPRIIGPEQVQGYVDALSQPGLGKHFVHVNMTDNKDDREQIEASLQHPNVVGIKIYPQGVTTAYDDKEVSKLEVQKGSTLRTAAQLCREYNKTLTIHCETPGRAAEADGALDFVHRTVFPLADAFPFVKIVVAHENLITSAEAIIAHNKISNNNIWMELGAKYMMLSRDKHLFAEDTPHGNPFYKCQPRLRDSHNNMALTGLLARIGEPGVNLVFGNDHAPHPIWRKLGFLSKDEFLAENYIRHESYKQTMNAALFQKAPGGIADFRHAVEAMLTAALQYSKAEEERGGDKIITYGKLTKFLSGNALETYSALADAGLPETHANFARTDIWQPTEDFYNGDVYNVWKHEKLAFKKQD